MTIRINGIQIDKWANLSVTLLYASVKSVFSFDLYWNPQDAGMRAVMLPGAYQQCAIYSDNGQLLLTGVMHSPSFKSGAIKYLPNISGYSLTGVLDDIEYSALFPTTQTSNLTLHQLCLNVCNALGLQLVDNTGAASQTTITQSDTDQDQIISEYLSEIAKELNIVLSHNENGNLVLSIAKDTPSIFDFTGGMPDIESELSFDGQRMHSKITAKTQGGTEQPSSVTNPYVPSGSGFVYKNAAINTGNIFNAPAGQLNTISEFSAANRPHIITKQSDVTGVAETAAQALADELSAIALIIKINRWELNNKIPVPGNYITMQDDELYLFNKTRFFIESVAFEGDVQQSVATLNCVVPEVYNGAVPVNIFTANSNNVKFVPPTPGSALQGGFAGQNNFIDL